MTNPRRPFHVSSTCKLFAPLALALLFVIAPAANAQNTANGNVANLNLTANHGAGAATPANSNPGPSPNQNVPANVNPSATPTPRATPTPTPTPTPDSEERRNKVVDSSSYYLLITLLFAALLFPFGMVIYRAIRFSKSTFNSPLGLPDGSLRAILAYTLVTFLGFYVYASVLSFSDFKPPEFLISIVATVVGFYFGSRPNEAKGGSAPAQTGVVEGTVKDKAGAIASGATVELTPKDGKPLTGSVGPDGKYKIENVPEGEQEIEAKPAAGSTDQPSDKVKVTVKAGETSTKDLTLK